MPALITHLLATVPLALAASTCGAQTTAPAADAAAAAPAAESAKGPPAGFVPRPTRVPMTAMPSVV